MNYHCKQTVKSCYPSLESVSLVPGVCFTWTREYFRPRNALYCCVCADGFMATCRADRQSICCKKKGKTAAFWSAKVEANPATLCCPSDAKTKSSTSWSIVRWVSCFTWLTILPSLLHINCFICNRLSTQEHFTNDFAVFRINWKVTTVESYHTGNVFVVCVYRKTQLSVSVTEMQCVVLKCDMF